MQSYPSHKIHGTDTISHVMVISRYFLVLLVVAMALFITLITALPSLSSDSDHGAALPTVPSSALVPAPADTLLPLKHFSILVLHSYHKGLTWTDSIAKGVDTALADDKLNMLGISVQLSHEFMDTKRIFTPAYIEQLAALYKTRYANHRFDAVISSDDHAFTFLRTHASSIFNNAPVVFCGVNNFKDKMLNRLPNFTGVVESIDIFMTLKTAIKLHPKADSIVVIGDQTLTGQANRKLFAKSVEKLEKKMKITYLDQHTMEEVQHHVSQLSSRDIVIWLHFTADAAGKFYTFRQSCRMIADASCAPLYSFWDFHLGYGIVGGMLINGFSQGGTAAQLTIEILKGDPPSSLPVIKKSPNLYMFDTKEMEQFSISPSQLPLGSVVINEPISFYTQHRQMVWFIIVVFCFLLTIILLLGINTANKKRAMNNLKESELKFRTIFTNAASGMAMVSLNGVYIQANSAFCNMLGYSQEELQKLHWKEITHPDDITATSEMLEQMAPGGEYHPLEKRYLNQQGQIIWTLINAASIRNTKGENSYYIIQVQDISHIRVAQERIREKEKRYRQLFEADLSGFYISSPDGTTILMCNQVFARILGYKNSAQAVGSSIKECYKDQNLRNSLLGQLQKKKTIKYLELDFFKIDGSPIQILLNSIGRFDKQGNLIEIQGYIMDITAQKNLENQLLHARKMESIGTMAGGIAHDFNNLLMAIMGNISLMLINRHESHEDWETLTNIDAYARSGSKLVQQLMGLAKGGKYEVKPVNLNEVIENNTTMFARTHKEIRVRTFLSPALWQVEADFNQIDQILYNLYVNAAHAMENKGELSVYSQNIILQTEELPNPDMVPGNYIAVSVKDTGCGIDKAIMGRIFDPFFTTKEVGKGTGLGLASAYGIISNHKGAIDVISRKGDGSEFRIYLPALHTVPSDINTASCQDSAPVKPDATALQQDAALTAQPLLTSSLSATILLVDDEEMVLDAVSGLLTHLSYKVITAENGEEALEIYRNHGNIIDLVILDMLMPDMDGGDTFELLKKVDPNVKAILSTGYSSDDQTAAILEKGCLGLISKPFDIDELSIKINGVLRH